MDWDGNQHEVRDALTSLEGYIDYLGLTDEDANAYDEAKRNIRFLYATTENMTRHLRKMRDDE